MALKLLFIDDDTTTRILLMRLAELRGHEALAATNGPEGIELARRQLPDAITLDVQMPGLDGRDVIARLKADPATAPIPVFILSGHEEEFTRAICLEFGAEDYLLKAFDFRTLIERIESKVEGRAKVE